MSPRYGHVVLVSVCFDRCQLIIAGISNIKEVHGKLRLYVSFLEYGRHVGQLRRRRRRAYAPTSNTASQDDHEKIDSWVSFIFPCMMNMGLRLAALRAAGAPLFLISSWSQFISSMIPSLLSLMLIRKNVNNTVTDDRFI